MPKCCRTSVVFQLVAGHLPGQSISSKNAVYASINKRKPVWWLQPANNKFTQNLYIILNDNNFQLLVFIIPANYFACPQTTFRQRSDKDYSHIEIETTGTTYRDILKSKISFAQFLHCNIPIAL